MSATIEHTNSDMTKVAPRVPDVEPSSYLRRKQLGVRFLGVCLGIPLVPIVLVLMGAVRLSSPGTALYRQRRVGLYGREFTIFKLRSMRQDAEVESGPVWAQANDNRVTPLGKILRYTHLDELPQIFNVIRGDMDFVGPRPERPEIVDGLIHQVAGYEGRLEAMPGITGIAQVNLPPDQSVSCVQKKVAADRYYIENASLWLDLRLVTATLLRMVGLRYHLGAKLLGVTLPESVRTLSVDLSEELQEDNSLEAVGLEEHTFSSTFDDSEDTEIYASTCDTVEGHPDKNIYARPDVVTSPPIHPR